MALQKLIHRRVLLQEAGRRNFTVDDDDLDQALISLRNRFEDLRSFGVWMKERGLDDRSLFGALRDQVLMTKVWVVLLENIRPSEEEVQVYYEANKTDLTIGEEVRLRIIAVKTRTAAEEIMADLRGGESFSRLAQKRSFGLRAVQGGDTGWINTRRLSPPLQKAVSMLKAGQAYGPLQKGDDEFLVVGLVGWRPVQAQNFGDAKPEIERHLVPAKQQEATEAWLAEHEKQSKIEVFPDPNDSGLREDEDQSSRSKHGL